jgi:hypothetical protein
MSDDLPMGEGRIELTAVPEEVRVIRHNLRNVQHSQGLQAELMGATIDRQISITQAAEEAKRLAEKAIEQARATVIDLYGHPDRKDDFGSLGDIRAQLRKQAAQNWAILLSILALVGVLVAAVWQGHH